MWQNVVQRICRLKAIDPQCQAFGAWRHRYSLRPVLSDSELRATENRLGITLPDALRSFYADVGDGVAGPFYGLKCGADLTGLRPTEPYPGIDSFRQMAASNGQPPDESGYFEVPRHEVCGLIPIIDEGCGHKTCLVSNGPLTGRVVQVSASGPVGPWVGESEQSLVDIYVEWLDRELELFETVRSLMASGMSYKQIRAEMVTRFDDPWSGDRIVSIVDTPKPPELFRNGWERVCYKETHFPWLERALSEWQQANL